MQSDLELPVRRQRRSRGGLVVGGVGVLLIAGSAISNALASAAGGGDTAWSPAMLTFGIVGCVIGALIFWMDATEKSS